MDMETFKQQMESRIEQTLTSKHAEGFDKVYMPGDIEQLNVEKHMLTGLTLPRAIYEELKELGKKF